MKIRIGFNFRDLIWWEINLINIIFNSAFLQRAALRFELSKLSKEVKGSVLDVGCGNKPYKTLFQHCTNYIGLEIDKAKSQKNCRADVFYDGIKFPQFREKFDNVLCFQVLYQVENPVILFQEILKNTKKGGTIIISVPFMWFDAEDTATDPSVNRRYSKKQIERKLSQYSEIASYEVIQSCSNAAAVLALTNHYFHLSTTNKIKNIYLKFALMIPTSPILNTIGLYFLFRKKKNAKIYIDNIIKIKLR